MFESMLQEGKEPPVIVDEGDAVRVIFLSNDFSAPFRSYVDEMLDRGNILTLENLLVIQYLQRHNEIDATMCAEICQHSDREARETLSKMEKNAIIECVRRGRNVFWRLRAEVEQRLVSSVAYSKQEIIANALTRVVGDLRERAESGKEGLTSKEIRQLVNFDATQAKYLMNKIREQGLARATGRGPNSRWEFAAPKNKKKSVKKR